MSAEKVHTLFEQIRNEISEMGNYEAEKAYQEQQLGLLKDFLKRAQDGRACTFAEGERFLEKVKKHFSEGEITQAKRDEYFSARAQDLVPFDQRIDEYEQAIAKVKLRIDELGEKIQEKGASIHVLMCARQQEINKMPRQQMIAHQLTPKVATSIFCSTRFNLTLFPTSPSSNQGAKSPTTIEEACHQYFSSYNSEP